MVLIDNGLSRSGGSLFKVLADEESNERMNQIFFVLNVTEFNCRKYPSNTSILLNPFPNDKNLDFPKLKEFADDNFRLYENGRKSSRWVEKTVEKGEIARYEQLLLFP